MLVIKQENRVFENVHSGPEPDTRTKISQDFDLTHSSIFTPSLLYDLFISRPAHMITGKIYWRIVLLKYGRWSCHVKKTKPHKHVNKAEDSDAGPPPVSV